ncbi:MarR family winged helix-turn-helix transcriptional regulator [Pseudonocardia sp. C8]|uniref:MarR family winged helix-turn-helix transcriptional regulator n=1 Tax=Pseudonocardia sp. C8 TaxID=2762759 RepID=UPI001C931531
MSSLTDRPSFLLSQLGFHVAAEFGRRLEPLDLRPRQFGMLTYLSAGGNVTQQELGARLGIHRNVVVGLIDDLERRGLAERRKHPDDRRAHAVRLTDLGRELLGHAERIADELDAELLGDDDRQALLHLLHRAAARAGLQHGVHPGLQAGPGNAPGAC